MEKTSGRVNVEGLKKELRRVVLAGVGAAVLAKEGAVDLAKKWVAKGEAIEPDLKKALKKVTEKRDTVGEKAGQGFRKAVGYLPVVTKNDFAELVKRIDTLSEKVESLRRKK